MNLKQLLLSIGELGIRQKLINYSAAGTSLSQINPLSIDFYPLLFQSPTGSHRVKENTTIYEITLYYVDRLLEDNSNDIEIFSSAIENLKNLVRGISFIDGVVDVKTDYIIRNFAETERMNDRLAGAYLNVQIEVVEDTICYTE